MFLDVERCSDNGTLRLNKFRNDLQNFGRLEICYEGYWGSVCDDIDFINQLSLPSLLVACKELGYSNL